MVCSLWFVVVKVPRSAYLLNFLIDKQPNKQETTLKERQQPQTINNKVQTFI